jgi:crossover junction endonuclease EME1
VAEKERKAEEKKREREEKAREKQRAAALAQVNTIRTDKKKSTPEMIVDLPSTLDETVRLQAETLLKDLGVESTSWTSPLDNVVKWRRKVNSQYNEQLGHWEPVEKRIDRENYAMVILTASQFVDLALGSGAADLETHALRMRRNFPNDTIIYLIEGLDLWLRKNRNIRNRQFVSAVRSGLEPPPPPPATDPPTSSQQQARRRKPTSEKPHAYIDQETIEMALLRLQVLHSPSVLIHHTTVPLETARWIAVFTQHISTVPYRRQREASNNTNFCIETGQVRTGDSPRDTYLCMLQEVGRVTAPIAYGIAAEYPTVSRLVKGLERDGPLALEKVRRCVDKDGGVGDRAVGPAVSKRLWKIFTGRDEASTDV